MLVSLYTFLDEQAPTLVSVIKSRFEHDCPATAASYGPRLEAVLRQMVEAFLDVVATGHTDSWDTVIGEFALAEWADPGEVLEMPLELLRVAGDEVLKMSLSEDNAIVQRQRAIEEVEQAARVMTSRLIELCQARLDGGFS